MNGQDFRNLLNTLETVDKKVNITESWNKWGEFLIENIRNFKIGDKVKFVDDSNNLNLIGKTGVITLLSGNGISQVATVKLDNDKLVTNILTQLDIIKESTLKEAETKTKTKSKVSNKMFQGTKDSQVQATKKSEPVRAPDASTRKRTKNVTLNKAVPMPDLDRIDKLIGKSDTDDDWGDLEMNAPQLAHNPTLALGQDTDTDTTDMAINAPANAETTEIAQRIHDIEWVNMLDLPGNMSQTIRNLGRRVFAAFGEQDFEFIDVVSSITHDEEDLDVVSGLVRQFGVPVQKDMLIDFQDTIPGYKAHAGVWTFGTQYYMFIKDEMGEYIYTWDNRTTNKLQHMEPMGNNSNKPLLNDIHEDTVSRVHFHNINDNPLHNKTYKGYKYFPNPERDEEGFDKLHHDIETPSGDWFSVAPDWFKQISPYKFPTAEEFKRAVDEISGN